MKILYQTPMHDIATVYVAKTSAGKLIEFVESTQPPYTRDEKWVLIISTLYGCPVQCPFCDANGFYKGKLSQDDLWSQIDCLVLKRFPNKIIPIPKFKIQFARMGEPTLNMNVISVLDEIQDRYNAPGLIPSLSSIAPFGCDAFFKALLNVKQEKYNAGNFQLQFSIHTTDIVLRDKLIPIKKWSFQKIANYGEKFYQQGDRKITLNFALTEEAPINPAVLKTHFSPDKFLIKLTPINPTIHAKKNKIKSFIDSAQTKKNKILVDRLKGAGFETLLSIGELEENKIGSNCGQYVQRIQKLI
jgi:23S rRNA (adenine2503-C2)-methyltransferase